MPSTTRLAILLTLCLLLAGCTGGGDQEQDTDGEGLRDIVETTPREIRIRAADGTETTRSVTSDINQRDTDGDGLEDLDEFVRGTDPRDVDTDSDGLLDGHDTELEPESELARAWRARGILENPPGRFLGELDQCPAYGGLKSADASSDRPQADKLGDGEELIGWNVSVRGGTPTHVTSDPCMADTDGDGLHDHDEKRRGSDPRKRDTDGDGVEDFADADPLWDLSLVLENITVTRTRGNGAVVLNLATGTAAHSFAVPGNDTVTLPVNDQTTTPGSLPVPLVVGAEDPMTGEPVALFEDARGIILGLDLLRGTMAIGSGEEGTVRDTLTTQGADGTLTLTWRTGRA